ncbi:MULTISPECIES: phenylpyruvate tautomerase MIF-related protein [unclassified Campylobacter]|uniref:phenylpyruvate tautomerase MIF-related protein n=1 Tax=unclassified Campylobacter TaxID=2593542 RepID=UPI0022E9D2A8|nr:MULTISPECIES: phenylpyruvate tautomerase MIF-related protein [unclassified Campylobacter]MDA3043204.1 phenylpyruvate tautomerase MIF-related protein [Campylobacter sp. JMF_09 ED2]MDA3045107.1 phenylpyruvate tautomerase MIF-related protein [Campylobacter sp. JMF_07 ED4]MDA3064293.1 phenylpyruvate tautomerase MIF-related protein [Campylobacter sp. JMF_11 EL3]MDA3071890.1 phenylpyruvate tautomerase MIF-related protein [Campylobacter sp. VBCF_03 NA9]MDA3075176.1 phenylpyruvate tautomerase MIF-r
MPYIDAKFSAKFDEKTLQSVAGALCKAVSEAFGKKSESIMSAVECDKALFIAQNALDSGAYIAISLLGTSVEKQKCEVCVRLVSEALRGFGINPDEVYVTFHPIPLWGRGEKMF